MPTVDERYAAATNRVRSTIAAVGRQQIGYALDRQGAARWFKGSEEAATLDAALAPIETRWLRATQIDERERAAREAEQLADRVAPAAYGCERDAGLIDVESPGNVLDEMNTVLALIRQLDADVRSSHVSQEFKDSWQVFVDEYKTFYNAHAGWVSRFWYATYDKAIDFRKRTLAWREKFASLGGNPSGPQDTPPTTATDQLARFAKLALIGGGIFAAYKIGSALWRERAAPRTTPRQSRSRSLPDAMNDELVIAAEAADPRNAKPPGFGPQSMCPVCHRFKNLDENERIEPHEYPTGGMCPGEGRLPLWPYGGKPRAKKLPARTRPTKKPPAKTQPKKARSLTAPEKKTRPATKARITAAPKEKAPARKPRKRSKP